MRIATWNVNSILARMPHVIRWIDAVKPDVLCMQETKCTDDKFPTLLFQERGYQCQLFGQQSYNGVIRAVYETYVRDDPTIDLVYLIEFDHLILRGDFERSLTELAASSNAGLFAISKRA